MPTLNLVALPIVAGLMAGTGAVAAYVTGPTPAPTAVTASAPVAAPAAVLPAENTKPAEQPCAAQTWPYLDAKCLTRVQPREHGVRVVTAPRADDTDGGAAVSPPAAQQASISPPDQLAPRSGLTSSDTVLYQPDFVVPPKSKAHAKRARERSQRFVRSYRVPSEDPHGTGALIVVRPLRLDTFR